VRLFSPTSSSLSFLISIVFYSTEAITKASEYVTEWLSKLTALVVGPGLGRNESVSRTATAIVQNAKKMQLPIVLDGVCQISLHDL
jgi:NAD(P)H-hydrate repair Nnr-like enzyme with NAD(P)H-hydrate dehydratase domain